MKYRVSGKSFTLPAKAPEWKISARPGGWLLAEGPNGERRRIAVAAGPSCFGANVSGKLVHGEPPRDAKARGAGGSAGGAGDSDLTAQFPGKVRKVLVVEGAQVAEGDPLVLVEAMKMEFTVKAPVTARVARVLVTEGQQLSPGDRFVELVASGDTERVASGDTERVASGDGNSNG